MNQLIPQYYLTANQALIKPKASLASIPDTLDTNIYDEVIQVTNEDAFATSQAFGHTEGVLVGISSGAALWAAQSGKTP